MIYESKSSKGLFCIEERRIFCGISAYKMNTVSDYYLDTNIESKNVSHPPIEYYRDKINVNVTYNNNINININTQPPKKPWNKLLDVILTIVKLITLIVSLYSLGDSDDDSSDNNLRLQLG